MHCGVSAVVLFAGPCSSLCCLCYSSCLYHAGSPALKQQLRADISGLKPRVQANFVRNTAATRGTASADAPAFASQGSAAFYALCSQYCDIAHMCLPYPTAPHVLAPEEDSALLHMAQHLVARMDTVRRNNERIKSEEVQPGALFFRFSFFLAFRQLCACCAPQLQAAIMLPHAACQPGGSGSNYTFARC